MWVSFVERGVFSWNGEKEEVKRKDPKKGKIQGGP
jgi:hypothetical protein